MSSLTSRFATAALLTVTFFAPTLTRGQDAAATLRPATQPTTRPATAPAVTIESPWRFKSAIDGFARSDDKAMPAKNGIVFIGSSTFTRWKVKDAFPSLPVLNRAFGGSHLSDCSYFIDRTIYRYQPKVVVIYCGENDVAYGKTAETVVNDFTRLIELIRAGVPDAKIVYLGFKPAPSRWKIADKMLEATALLKAEAEKQNVTFVDPWKLFLGASGEPRKELYVADNLHTNDDGYALIKSVLEPAILAAWGK